MKHIKTWQERVNEGDSIFAKVTALEAEVAELREHIDELQLQIRQAQERSIQARQDWIAQRNYLRPGAGENLGDVVKRICGL